METDGELHPMGGACGALFLRALYVFIAGSLSPASGERTGTRLEIASNKKSHTEYICVKVSAR